ncbi:MAG TPA: nitrate reductase [Firmicutes bacterium]|nr:nitrate reductase [Bacillota bacterium]
MAQQDRPSKNNGILGTFRVLIFSLVIIIAFLGIALVNMTISRAPEPVERVQVDALSQSKDSCVTCHRRVTPGIVHQYSHSTMALAEVTCRNCHEVSADYPGNVAHEGTWVLASPTPTMCAKCHASEVREFYQSRHAAPAYAAMKGVENFSPAQLAMYQSIPEGSYSPDKERNDLYHIEGDAITRFACHGCHDIGKPHPDDSIGQCQKCHIRHDFSLEQARKPETCNACHIGPDHPQWEIYIESPHGILYHTGGYKHNWDAEPGTLSVIDFPSPNCATCHMSGFGSSGTTHDVGDRLTWYLFSSVSERRPAWEDNKVRMQGVCRECHNQQWIEKFYEDADKATEAVNAIVLESRDVIAPLIEHRLLTDEPFDETIDFVFFNLWHHWGRTAKFGSWMQGPDYVQWHGAYEMLHDLAHLREMTAEKLERAGISHGTNQSGGN